MNTEHLLIGADMSTLAVMGLPGGWEWAIILVIGLLLFGRRLPEVGRSLGKSIVEFKRGLQGIEDEVNSAATEDAPGRIENRESSTIDTTASAAPSSESTASGTTGSTGQNST